MRTRSKLIFTGLTAALLLSFAVAGASANRLSVSSETFRIVWNPLTLESTSEIAAIECGVTLEGSFHSKTIEKIQGTLVGYVTRGSVDTNNCVGGKAHINQESFPWHVRYLYYTGTLPNVTGVALALVGAEFAITEPVNCNTSTTESQPGVGIGSIEAGGSISGMRADEEEFIPLEGEFLCLFAGEGSFEGTGTVTVLGSEETVQAGLA